MERTLLKRIDSVQASGVQGPRTKTGAVISSFSSSLDTKQQPEGKAENREGSRGPREGGGGRTLAL